MLPEHKQTQNCSVTRESQPPKRKYSYAATKSPESARLVTDIPLNCLSQGQARDVTSFGKDPVLLLHDQQTAKPGK
jgi:hypothetical protein